jgi:O-antigen/teichoic acid export membrane protein
LGRSKDVNIRIAKGVFWAGTTQVITQAISFAVNVIVARLLYPDDFGILGMAAMSLDLMGTITDLGVNSAIIQRHEVTEEQLSTCFWINVLVGVALMGSAVVCAPTIAGFFKKGLVGPVIVVSSFGFLLRAAGGVHRAILTKRLDFRRLTVPEIVSILFFSITVIPMAWGGIGLWSVVIANLAGGIASTIALWVLHPWREAGGGWRRAGRVRSRVCGPDPG